MKYIITSDKTADQASDDFVEAVSRNGFGVLHSYNLKEILTGKGFPLEPEVRVFEICNPARAAEVLASDMEMNMALPCRVSIWEKDGKTHIGMINPSSMLSMLSEAPELEDIATSVENTIKTIMDETK
ncbi:MAG: DUF302 domain-containing protein [Bacteroidetes Order II. Incertae sedis bacterium]|jgi:uncharacterized protein (DUF302 family)|nr:DUF302 domain-containing protein [Bacteroidetes Order II. bacterium]MDG1754671.1 DUF302 domain-containing protein [Rhodothermales bacterium]MBT4603297.1 DUF302 domain-containing protein [Bacteroidetes Order II. bacterium]MBT5249523.1 DUF302 domain-containing protein [Bacteroidetes Order II. bacterium]MBT6201564.1 DUF302 domain-containing protein [Bacteroidetes Order II. bacterium]